MKKHRIHLMTISIIRHLWKYLSELQTLTLPLSEEGILHHSKLASEEDELALYQGLGEDVCQLLICRNILELDCSLQHHVPDEMVFDLNVLQIIMKHWILREFDKTLVIIVDQRRLKLLTKQSL
jgi:hypothetical protein